MDKYDLIIIGGGPAGLFTAIMASINNKKVAILEKNNKCGRKLLMTGLGKCNITQDKDIFDFFNNFGSNHKFLKHALLNFTNKDLLKFFESKGMPFITTENHKVFPKSQRAHDVLDILVNECLLNKVNIIYNSPVINIKNIDNKFIVQSENKIYESNNVVIATGGLSYPVTGSTGDGQRLAKILGHKVESLKPALTPLKINDYKLVELSGLSFSNLTYSLWRNEKKISTYQGDILLTHTGLSGPGILNNSRDIQSKDILKLNFVGNHMEEFKLDLIKKLSSSGKILVKTIIRDLPLPKRLIDTLLIQSNINNDIKCAELKKEQRNLLISLLTEYPMEVKELGGFNMAMVTSGGVSLKEIHPQTMESRLIGGLYFIGEVLDIDGDTGGYNLQAAFSTAYIAAQNINKNLNN